MRGWDSGGKGTRCHMGFRVRNLYQMRHEEWPESCCSNMAATCSHSRAVCKELIPSFWGNCNENTRTGRVTFISLAMAEFNLKQAFEWMLSLFCWERCRDSGGLFVQVFQRARFKFLTVKIHKAGHANVRRQHQMTRTVRYEGLVNFILAIFHLIIIN